MGGTAGDDRSGITALSRGLAVLRCFTAEVSDLSTVEIARLTGLPQPTVWRICRTLIQDGYMSHAPGGTRLRVTPKVMSLGLPSLKRLGFIAAAAPAMQELADRFRGAVSLSTGDRAGMLILQRCLGDQELTLNISVGSIVPFGRSVLGWAYLAGISPGERSTIIGAMDTLQRPPMDEILAEVARHGNCVKWSTVPGDFSAVGMSFRIQRQEAPLVVGCAVTTGFKSAQELRAEVGVKLKAIADGIKEAAEW